MERESSREATVCGRQVKSSREPSGDLVASVIGGQEDDRREWQPAAPPTAKVVLDDCALDGDFNRDLSRRERELRGAGVEAAAAHDQTEAAARAVDRLDPTFVARIRPYADFEPGRQDALRRADTFGISRFSGPMTSTREWSTSVS
jgi:hypothetical protein